MEKMDIKAITKSIIYFLCICAFILFLQVLLILSLASTNILIPLFSIFIAIVGIYDFIQIVNVNKQINNSNSPVDYKTGICF